jgi:hypothetical protein
MLTGHLRVRFVNDVLEQMAPQYVAPYTKANGWTDLRYIKIPFKAILGAQLKYGAYKTVPQLGVTDPNYHLWFNSSFVSGATLLGKTIQDEAVIFPDIVGKTEKRRHFYFIDNVPHIGRIDDPTKVQFASQGGPLLLWDNELVYQEAIIDEHIQDDVANQLQPRTLVGIDSGKYLVLVFVDGRGTWDRGFYCRESALMLKALGCQYGINLDGGASTTIYTPIPIVQEALDMRKSSGLTNTHVCDSLQGGSPRAVSHAAGLELDLPFMFPELVDLTTLSIDKAVYAEINGELIKNGFLINNTTYIPLRATGDALGATVTWDGETARLKTN